MKRIFTAKYADNGIAVGLFILRLFAGGIMIPHGYQKLTAFGAKAATFSDPFELEPEISMGLTIFAEFFCAMLVLAGLMTRLAVIPLIIVMCVALFVAHDGAIFGKGEHAALFLGAYLALLFTGPGKLSLDRLLGK